MSAGDLDPIGALAKAGASGSIRFGDLIAAVRQEALAAVEPRMTALEAEVADLKARVAKLNRALHARRKPKGKAPK